MRVFEVQPRRLEGSAVFRGKKTVAAKMIRNAAVKQKAATTQEALGPRNPNNPLTKENVTGEANCPTPIPQEAIDRASVVACLGTLPIMFNTMVGVKIPNPKP